jgi:hypothetical protein
LYYFTTSVVLRHSTNVSIPIKSYERSLKNPYITHDHDMRTSKTYVWLDNRGQHTQCHSALLIVSSDITDISQTTNKQLFLKLLIKQGSMIHTMIPTTCLTLPWIVRKYFLLANKSMLLARLIQILICTI